MSDIQFPMRLEATKDLPGSVLLWAHPDEIEESAIEQIKAVAQLPGLYGLRVMPDVHWGNGATVGSVIAMEQALAPAAVGVDIGCGVNAVKTNLNINDLDAIDLKILRGRFEDTIPVGFQSYSDAGGQLLGLGAASREAIAVLDRVSHIRTDLTSRKKNGEIITTDTQARSRAAFQLGTLGGGNHFIELCTDSIGDIWITLHSGSRNLGKVVAEAHIDKAKKLPENFDLPNQLQDLAMFYKGTPQMDDYLNDLRIAQAFAMSSRTVMMERIKKVLEDYFWDKKYNVIFEDEINCHHNYVSEELVDGREMIVTRKGAISARKGERALIPGNMANGSYIVRGLGNPASFQSASHGAGRTLSRKAAMRKYSVDDLVNAMKGIEARTDIDVLDEIPMAYKNLDHVISSQKDLVQVEEKLDTILCVKG